MPTVTEIGPGHEDYAKAFTLSLEEIAYDGEIIYLSGTMPGPVARPFVQVYTGGDTIRCAPYDGSLGGPVEDFYYFACDNYVSLNIADGQEYLGEIIPSMTEEMRTICSLETSADAEPVYENGELITSNPITDRLWDAYLADHDVRFTIELHKVYASMQPLSGVVSGTLSLELFYGNVDFRDPSSVLKASLGRITIDADAYKTQTTQAQIGKTVQLGGIHPVTIHEWQPEAERTSVDCEVYYYTRELDFAGASVSFQEITFTPTDTKLTLHVQLPASWSIQERQADSGAIHFRILLDGEEVPFNTYGARGIDADENQWLAYHYDLFNSAIPPSQWAAAKTLTIIPMTKYFWEMYAEYDKGPKEYVSLRNGVVYTGIANHTGYEFDALYDEMPEYAITIHLDDYR